MLENKLSKQAYHTNNQKHTQDGARTLARRYPPPPATHTHTHTHTHANTGARHLTERLL